MPEEKGKTSFWDMVPRSVLVSTIMVLGGIILGTNIIDATAIRRTFEEENPSVEETVRAVLKDEELQRLERERSALIDARLDTSEARIERLRASIDSSFTSLARGLWRIQTDIKQYHQNGN